MSDGTRCWFGAVTGHTVPMARMAIAGMRRPDCPTRTSERNTSSTGTRNRTPAWSPTSARPWQQR